MRKFYLKPKKFSCWMLIYSSDKI